ncbi:response regulator transcription factor [Bosea psychrotolerans]|uniref:Two-component system OmpR family response regulator n=1 Tax=Bosea psychrotolerans TaxID=1871628 RepID=A0A2S4MCT1_9HYPH|nr:response regulator transcription factor [Bosea psychrotolerans]POR52542.1 two-component system OmpR family response regulator [Bosea psychrotolerans]
MAPRILVVDDDSHIREVICFALEKAGMATVIARDGVQALESFRRQPADLVILDIGMPEMDGLEVCRQLRKSSDAPILFLSARDEEIDRVLGLEIGGDDYVTKPFSPRELVARVSVILKRTRPGRAVAAAPAEPLSRGALQLDPEAHLASFAGKALALTGIEFAILKAFAARPRQVFSREQILESAYAGAVHVADRTIDSHIRNIRAKLAALGCDSAIETVHGVGFRLGRCEAGP